CRCPPRFGGRSRALPAVHDGGLFGHEDQRGPGAHAVEPVSDERLVINADVSTAESYRAFGRVSAPLIYLRVGGFGLPFRLMTRKLCPCRCIECHHAVSLRSASRQLLPR